MKKLLIIVSGSVVTMLAALAHAQEGPTPVVDPGAATTTLTDAISKGLILVGVCAGGMLVIYFLNLFLIPKLQDKAKAWTATILIGALEFFVYMSQYEAPEMNDWVMGIFGAVSAGLAAGKAWDLLPDKAKAKLKAPILKKRNGG